MSNNPYLSQQKHSQDSPLFEVLIQFCPALRWQSLVNTLFLQIRYYIDKSGR